MNTEELYHEFITIIHGNILPISNKTGMCKWGNKAAHEISVRTISTCPTVMDWSFYDSIRQHSIWLEFQTLRRRILPNNKFTLVSVDTVLKQLSLVYFRHKLPSVAGLLKTTVNIIYMYFKTFITWIWRPIWKLLEFFTNSPQCKKANIANFVLALPSKINKSNKMCNLEKYSSNTPWFPFSHLLNISWWK